MKRLLVALGLVTVPLGVYFIARKAKASAAQSEGALTPELENTLKQWLNALDVDHIGEPEHKKPDAMTIIGATAFAAELDLKGYHTSAGALRTAITLSQG